jgi:hypothetical protein
VWLLPWRGCHPSTTWPKVRSSIEQNVENHCMQHT